MTGYNKDTAPHYRPSRDKKKTIVFYTSQEKSAALRHLAIDMNKTLQGICELAMDEFLTKYGTPVKQVSEQKEAVG